MRTAQKYPRDRHAPEFTVTYDIETIVDHEPADGSFPPIHRHQPVAAAFLRQTWTQGSRYEFSLDVPIRMPGKEAEFFSSVNRCLQGAVGIGWNTRNFDNPVLRNQAWRAHQLELPALSHQCQAGRYENGHLDLADQLSGYGGSRTMSLAAICEVLEIPVKLQGHGSHVGDLWAAGDLAAIERYVAEDVVATYLVALHWFAWRDSDPSLMILPLADLAVWLEQSDGLDHLRPFATCRPARWARQQAPALRAKMAARHAELRRKREQDDASFTS